MQEMQGAYHTFIIYKLHCLTEAAHKEEVCARVHAAPAPRRARPPSAAPLGSSGFAHGGR